MSIFKKKTEIKINSEASSAKSPIDGIVQFSGFTRSLDCEDYRKRDSVQCVRSRCPGRTRMARAVILGAVHSRNITRNEPGCNAAH